MRLDVRVLAFDVFGTVVDWRSGVARDVAEAARRRGVALDAHAFADRWRAGYAPAMQRVRSGALPWTRIDDLHRMILDDLLPQFGLAGLPEGEIRELNRAWHRLDPWPDALEGLARLKRRYTVTTLSNGNFSLLTAMAKRAGLPWDCIVSAELFRHYKPDPETYLGCARLLDATPDDLMLVAAHPDDLRAARAAGCRTAYVARPLEFGPGGAPPAWTPGEFDLDAQDFIDLAQQLGA